jgi:multidrug efflux pump subunit AcrA (membrane-fusion protein)
MAAILPIILRYWWIALIAAAGAWMYIQRLQIEHYKADYQKDEAAIGALQIAAKLQAARSAAVDQANKVDHDQVQNQLASALAAHAATSAALTDRVRAYEALRGACAVPGKPDPARPLERGNGSSGSPSGAGPIGEAIAGLVTNCQTVIDEFKACDRWTHAVKCQ